MLYRRLDELQRETEEQLASVRSQGVGGGHQARSERDSFARLYEDRILQLRDVGERLAFGRISVDGDDGELLHRYIGRIGLRDSERVPILLDWRVPQASAFYQATARTPMGARARRHLISSGRKLVRIEDEVFDPELLDDGSLQLQGEGALLAALTAQRTGRMSDIVATIQAEQDRIIRSDLGGILVVQGGPGTGKTAVALHRAAYLLYSNRERLRSSGVLIVGPSRSFLKYIEAVLPSLGESGVVLASVGQLYPGVEATQDDPPSIARIKGRTTMASLLAHAVASRQRIPDAPQPIEVNGDTIILEPETVASAIQRGRESGKTYNEARVIFAKAAVASITRTLAAQLRAQGNSLDESDLAMLREDVRSAQDARVALNTAWLPLTPEKLLQDLYARPHWLASLTPDWSAADRELLRRDRTSPFTISDIPLLDEAAELLGEVATENSALKRETRQQRRRDIENAERAIENMGVKGIVSAESLASGFAEFADAGTTAERAAADRTWAFGHIVVDEAQELSPMQWRLLLRRGPSRSFTIVGDIAQAAAVSAAETWEHALIPLIGHRAEGDRWRREELTVNYRTPSQIAAAAESMAIAHGLPVTKSVAVRESEWPIDTVADVVDAVRLAQETRGTVAVIATDDRAPVLLDTLDSAFPGEVGIGAEGLDSAITVLGAHDAKGLEFDAVVIVDPAAIVHATERGAAALFVAMTRPTQRLVFADAEVLPAGL
ncbi:HelD family protein [Terrimesophilobacter mesophilus]|uniref:AAA family ATPase n=3 Tax=Terrimesophilobacter mesophilus TaxID=433647 RepID=A0A4V3I9A0_9MICO|nr:UvrD-helicase domain-containing protein [Terrimesophilobacter mesophilus]TFB78698.1 AAA family ATPase [Terrimesophilobacter mesophilus]